MNRTPGDHDDLDLESRLSRHFRTEAAGTGGDDDWDDITARLRRNHRSRQRVAGGVAVVAMLAAGAAGFGIGRHRPADSGTQVSALGPSSPSSPAAASTPVPVVPRPADRATPSFLTEQGSTSLAPDAAQGGTNGEVFEGKYRVLTGPWAMTGGEPLGRLFVRTADGGIVVRGYRADYQAYDDGNPFWDPPDWCYPAGVLQADVSTDAVAGMAIADVYTSVRDGSIVGSVGLLGVGEGAPLMVAIAQLPAGADGARATFPGGAVDSMTATDGVVMLAGTVPASAVDQPSVKIDATAGGRTVASATLDWEMDMPSSDPACQVPAVTLPPPGDQPADAAAARAAVIHAFDTVYGPSSEADKEAAVDDPDNSLAAIRQQLATGAYADAVASAHARVDDLVFDRPDHAWVQYTILTSMGSFSQRFGEASVVGGTWKIAESTVCKDVSLAGIQCSG
jgi:hypothetical protein